MSESTHKPKSIEPKINVGAQQVAAIYAKAFLGAAEKSGQVDALVDDLHGVVEVLRQFPKLNAVLSSALVSDEEKQTALEKIFSGRLAPMALDFLKVLSRHGRLDILPTVEHEVHKLHDQLSGRIRVRLVTAAPLANGQEAGLQASLRKVLGGEPQVDAVVDPQLIGGVVLRVGDTVYDGSVARQLSQVREQMITRSIHEIQSRRDRFRHSGGN